jgi:hypothetical protein
MLDDLFMDEPAITHAQFVQDEAAALDVYLVLKARATFGTELHARVVGEVCSIMGPTVHVRVHVVPDIPRNPRSGKFPSVVCRVAGSNRSYPSDPVVSRSAGPAAS